MDPKKEYCALILISLLYLWEEDSLCLSQTGIYNYQSSIFFLGLY